LVIYYHNYVSYNSGMVIVLCNRIGDVGILIHITIRIIIKIGRWELVMFKGRRGVNIFIFILIILSLLLTAPYSMRLFSYLLFNTRLKFYRYMNIKEDRLINYYDIFKNCNGEI
ncbi:NU5M oxidoreductase, partial [Acromyrmex charruanus]